MRKKADSKQAKANKTLRASAVAALAESAIREPPAQVGGSRHPPACARFRDCAGCRRE